MPGHWEGDLLLGKRPSAVATLVERASRYLTLVALPDGYKAEQVRPALAAAVARLPEQLRRSLTCRSAMTSPWARGGRQNHRLKRLGISLVMASVDHLSVRAGPGYC